MKVWAWLHLPSAVVATSTKTVVVAGLLVGMTTTATAGVVMLGSSAVRMQITQGQQPIPHLGPSEQTGRTPVVVVPSILRPVAATPETTPPVAPTVSPPPGATASEATVVAAPPAPAAAPAAQPSAPAPVPPATVKAHAAATSTPPLATTPPATTPPRAATPPSAPSPAAAMPALCGTITASQADRAVIAQYSCRSNAKPNDTTKPADAGNGQDASQQGDNGEPSRGHVHRR